MNLDAQPEAAESAVVARSRHSYSDTLRRLADAIAASGGTMFATIDQSRAAQTVGLALRPTTLLIFGNPKAGTPLMDALPLVGLDLPLKTLVWEEDRETFVAYTPMSELARRYGIVGRDPLLANSQSVLATVIASVT
jgi:uncharacterized protein (DUF302 family)